MKLKPIETDAEYRAALAEIEGLFDALPNTPEGDRLELWTTLVAAYEEDQFSIPRPDPIEAVRHRMETRVLNVLG